MRWVLSAVWAIFTILFLVLGCAHWSDAKTEIPQFKLSERPGQASASITVLGADIDQPIKNFTSEFNKYLETQNESSRISNRRAAYGYFLASLTAVVSMCLELRLVLRQRSGRAA